MDLDALERNLATVRAAAGGADVMLVVKADAYGHGAVPVAWHLAAHGGVACLGVGDSTEALELAVAVGGGGATPPTVVVPETRGGADAAAGERRVAFQLKVHSAAWPRTSHVPSMAPPAKVPCILNPG